MRLPCMGLDRFPHPKHILAEGLADLGFAVTAMQQTFRAGSVLKTGTNVTILIT